MPLSGSLRAENGEPAHAPWRRCRCFHQSRSLPIVFYHAEAALVERHIGGLAIKMVQDRL
jgi:hypothetical protein